MREEVNHVRRFLYVEIPDVGTKISTSPPAAHPTPSALEHSSASVRGSNQTDPNLQAFPTHSAAREKTLTGWLVLGRHVYGAWFPASQERVPIAAATEGETTTASTDTAVPHSVGLHHRRQKPEHSPRHHHGSNDTGLIC